MLSDFGCSQFHGNPRRLGGEFEVAFEVGELFDLRGQDRGLDRQGKAGIGSAEMSEVYNP
jgi:hypothetical protein